MRQLRESLLEELNSKNMLETIGTFNHLFRYSGTAEGEAAVSYLEEKLSEYGIPFEHCEYDGFFSLPVRAFAKVDGVEYPLVGDVYSAEADSLQGTLYYDSLSEEKGLTKNQEKDRFESEQQHFFERVREGYRQRAAAEPHARPAPGEQQRREREGQQEKADPAHLRHPPKPGGQQQQKSGDCEARAARCQAETHRLRTCAAAGTRSSGRSCGRCSTSESNRSSTRRRRTCSSRTAP